MDNCFRSIDDSDSVCINLFINVIRVSVLSVSPLQEVIISHKDTKNTKFHEL